MNTNQHLAPSASLKERPIDVRLEAFGPDSRLGAILDCDAGRDFIASVFPGIEQSPAFTALAGLPISELAVRNPALNDPERSEAFWKELASIQRQTAPRDMAPAKLPNTHYEGPEATRGSGRVVLPAHASSMKPVEIRIDGPFHGNPFVDVELTAEISGPEVSQTVGGFYDGDGRYLIRFLPTRDGMWTINTSSSAPSLDGIEVRVEVEGAPAGPGPVRVADTFHFEHADGTNFVPLGTTLYAWTHQNAELRSRTLETLSHSPFNKVRMCVFPKSYLYNTEDPELFPFIRAEDGKWDFERFDPEFFRQLEEDIAALGELGIQADLILFHPYDRWGFATMGRAIDDRYAKYVTRRLSAFPNVWWSLANEYDLMWSKGDHDWDRLANVVTQNDPVKHLISIHNGLRIWDYDSAWATHASLQRVDVYRSTENVTEWREKWGKPVVVDEPGYEGNLDQGWGNITGEELVRRSWEATVRGGYITHGETYYSDDEVIWWAKGGTLRGSSPARLEFLRRIISEVPGGRINPLVSDWDAPRGGTENHFIVYFGFNQPVFRNLIIPPGKTAEVDLIDTWNMTIEKLEGTLTGMTKVQLPGRPFLALRVVLR